MKVVVENGTRVAQAPPQRPATESCTSAGSANKLHASTRRLCNDPVCVVFPVRSILTNNVAICLGTDVPHVLEPIPNDKVLRALELRSACSIISHILELTLAFCLVLSCVCATTTCGKCLYDDFFLL